MELMTAEQAGSGRPTVKGAPNLKLGNWEQDADALALTFQASAENLRKYTAKKVPDALRVKLFAVYKQATIGDCHEPKPFDARQREKWAEWCKFVGTPKLVAQRRYITLLRTFDPSLIEVVVAEQPPPAFPTTLYGEPICARCNTKVGCCQPLLLGDGTPLIVKLMEDPSLLTPEKLRQFVGEADATKRCKWGRHCAIGKDAIRPFLRWFNAAGMGGFQQYNPAEDKSFENMLRALLYQQFQKLHAMDLIKEQLTYKELSAQVDTCDGLKKFFKDFTGHEFVYEVWCDRDVPHCNERRGFSNGENHKHPVVIERPTVDFSVYEGVAALRREVMRLGLSPSTGTEVDPSGDGRKMALALRIADHHRKRMLVHEAVRSQKARTVWHPQQKEDVKTWSVTQMNEQMVSAIATRDFETVHILVRRGAPIEIEAPGGLTAVIVATIEGHKHVLAQLAEIGADIDNFNSYGLSALSWALKRGDLVMVHHLLDIGAAIAKMPAQGGDPPLAVAARHGQIETIDVLLEHAEKLGPLEQQRLVNQQNNLNGGTALMIAARQRDMRTVRYLMRAGALAEVHDDQQLTASDHAFNRELGGFIANNKNVGAAGMESFSEKQQERRMRLAYGRLQAAIASGEEMPATGAAAAARPRESDDDIAGDAPESTLPRSIEYIKTGDVSPNLETADGTTALIAAAYAGKNDAVKILLREGCDPSYANRNARTALMAAAAGGCVETCLELLQAGADLYSCDLEGKNAIAHSSSDRVTAVLMAMRTGGIEAAEDTAHPKGEKSEGFDEKRDKLFAELGCTPQTSSDGPEDYDSWRWRLPAPRQPPRKPSSRALPAARTVPPLPLKSRETADAPPMSAPADQLAAQAPDSRDLSARPEAEAPAALSSPTGKDAEAEPPASLLLDAGGERDPKLPPPAPAPKKKPPPVVGPPSIKELQRAAQDRRAKEIQRAKQLALSGGETGETPGATRPAAETAAEPEGDAPGVAAARAATPAAMTSRSLGERDMEWDESRAVTRRAKQNERGSTISMRMAPVDPERTKLHGTEPSTVLLAHADEVLSGMDDWRQRLDRFTLLIDSQPVGAGRAAAGSEIYSHPAELSYANFMMGKRRYGEAEATLRQLLAVQQRKLGEGHVATAYTWRALGALEEARGRHHLALEYRERSMEVLFSLLGPTETETTHAIELVAKTLLDASRWDEARHLYSQLSKKFERSNIAARRVFADTMRGHLDQVSEAHERQLMDRADAASRGAQAATRTPQGARSGRDRAELAPLEALMNEPHQAAFHARASFRAFCERSDTGVTALDFCIAVEDFHRISPGEPVLAFGFIEIFKKFVRPKGCLPELSQATRRGIVVEMERNGGRPSPQAYDSAQQEVLRGVADVYVRFLDTREGARWVTDHYAWSHHARGISRLQARHRGRTTRKLGGDVPAIAKAYWRRIDELNADVEDLMGGQKAKRSYR